MTVFVYRSLSWENFLKAAAQGGEDHRRRAAADRHLGDVRLPHEPLQRGRAHRRGAGAASRSTPWVIFLLVNIILFLLGTFLDMAATILICTPIFLPICMQYGMDPVQFGMVMLINCALGLNTPPVGTTQFVGCAIGEISVGHVMRTIWPFYGALIAALMLVTYVPAFSLWLPRACRLHAALTPGALRTAAGGEIMPGSPRPRAHAPAASRTACPRCPTASPSRATTSTPCRSASSTSASARSIARTRRSTPTTRSPWRAAPGASAASACARRRRATGCGRRTASTPSSRRAAHGIALPRHRQRARGAVPRRRPARRSSRGSPPRRPTSCR